MYSCCRIKCTDQQCQNILDFRQFLYRVEFILGGNCNQSNDVRTKPLSKITIMTAVCRYLTDQSQPVVDFFLKIYRVEKIYGRWRGITLNSLLNSFYLKKTFIYCHDKIAFKDFLKLACLTGIKPTKIKKKTALFHYTYQQNYCSE